jgi:hypothetical protein
MHRHLYLCKTVLLFDRPFVFRIYFLEFSGLMGYYTVVPFDASPGGDDSESEEDNKNEDDHNDNDEEGT